MVKTKNNIVIPKDLTSEEVKVRMEVNELKVRLLDKEVWSHFSNEIILRKNSIELAQQFFDCSSEAAEYLMSLSLMDLVANNNPESLEQERQLLLEGKAFQ